MKDKELYNILADIQSSPAECEWIEIKKDNCKPDLIGEYISALSNGAAYMGQSRAYLAFGLDDTTHNIVGTDFDPKEKRIGNQEIENWIATQLSPRIDFSIHELNTEKGKVVIFIIDSAGNTPVKFKGISYIRVGSYKKSLSDHPERERKIWQNTHHACFETKIAKSGVSEEEVLQLIDYPIVFKLLNIPLPENRNGILDKLNEEHIIIKRPSCYDITNLGAILFATKLDDFITLKRKSIRLIFYKGNNRINAIREIDSGKGYAIEFEKYVDYINANLPINEAIGKALRKDIPMYPSLAIREFVANALIHQDFYIGGSSPMIEVFSDRLEITNPGKPLIDILRFIDHAPLSRNEKLAAIMRRMKFCEERGSGIDRALDQCELYQLPAPEFIKDELFTKVTMFAPKTMRQMNNEDKIRACYQHCCLQFVSGKKMTNESFRDRLGIEAKNYSIASRIIADTIEAKLVKPYSDSQSKKYAQYIPIWA